MRLQIAKPAAATLAGFVIAATVATAAPAWATASAPLTSIGFSATEVPSAGKVDILYNGSTSTFVQVAGYCRITVFMGEIRSSLGFFTDTTGDVREWTPSNPSGLVQPYEMRIYNTDCEIARDNFGTATPIFTATVSILPALSLDSLTVDTGAAVDATIDYSYHDDEATTIIDNPAFRVVDDSYCQGRVFPASAGPMTLAPGLTLSALEPASGEEPVLHVSGVAGAPGTYTPCVASGSTADYLTITITGPKLAETGADAAKTAALLGGAGLLVIAGAGLLLYRRRAAKRLTD